MKKGELRIGDTVRYKHSAKVLLKKDLKREYVVKEIIQRDYADNTEIILLKGERIGTCCTWLKRVRKFTK